MACTLSDLAALDCADENLGGLVGEAFIIPVADIDATSLPTLDADGVTLTGNIIAVSTKRWFQVYHTKSKGKLEDNSVGERDGKSFENVVEIFHPGTRKEISAFKKQIQNTPVVIAVKEGANTRVIGITTLGGAVTLDLPAYAETLSGTTGAATADLKGSTLNFKAEATGPAMYYSGTLSLVPVV